MHTNHTIRVASYAVIGAFCMTQALKAQPFNCDNEKQGFSMKLMLSNKGDIGRVAYNPCNLWNPTSGLPFDSLGLEYPIGKKIEHIYSGGLWIGGILDTARIGTSTPLRLVSVSYEGWAGPLYEFLPGSSPADTIWKTGLGQPTPAGWDQYWGGALPFNPISHQDLHCTYTDTAYRPAGHIPMRLKVIQSSYAWDDPLQRPIVMLEYRLNGQLLDT